MPAMERAVTDHLGREVRFAYPPQRIVSLCPSLTETLLDLGLAGRVVGRTKYCIHPADRVGDIADVGGTKQVDLDRLRSLEPDLVIAEKEENTREQIDTIAREVPVFVVDVNDLAEALRAVRDLGELTSRRGEAMTLMDRIRVALDGVHPALPAVKVAYLIWRNPYMAAARHTYIDALLRRCGLVNVCAQLDGRYPEVTLERLGELGPRFVLLASEPFPFADGHRAEIEQALPAMKAVGVNGELFSWYGSRLLRAAPYFNEVLRRLRGDSITKS
jgi:iron complex transport system substrate-binding protein